MRKPAEFQNHPVQYPTPEFRGVVKHVVDGDTLDVLLDQGFNCYAYLVLRIRGIDAPEVFSGTLEERERGRAARDRLMELALGRACVVQTWKDRQTFGRYEANVAIVGSDLVRFDLAETLVREGHAVWSDR